MKRLVPEQGVTSRISLHSYALDELSDNSLDGALLPPASGQPPPPILRLGERTEDQTGASRSLANHCTKTRPSKHLSESCTIQVSTANNQDMYITLMTNKA